MDKIKLSSVDIPKIIEFLKNDDSNMTKERNNTVFYIVILTWSMWIYMTENIVVRFAAITGIVLMVIILLHMKTHTNFSDKMFYIYHAIAVTFWWGGCLGITNCLSQKNSILQKYALVFWVSMLIVSFMTYIRFKKKIYNSASKEALKPTKMNIVFFMAIAIAVRPIYSFFNETIVFGIFAALGTIVFCSYSLYCWLKVYCYCLIENKE